MKKIRLTRGKYALVDDEDFEWLSQWKWNCGTPGYAVRKDYSSGSYNPKCIYMHRSIISVPTNLEIDHINGNKLDNRRKNLRICNSSQNKCNKPVQTNNKLGIKGISWSEERKRYVAQLCVNKKRISLGRFKSLEEAIKVHREATIRHHGEFARLQ